MSTNAFSYTAFALLTPEEVELLRRHPCDECDREYYMAKGDRRWCWDHVPLTLQRFREVAQ